MPKDYTKRDQGRNKSTKTKTDVVGAYGDSGSNFELGHTSGYDGYDGYDGYKGYDDAMIFDPTSHVEPASTNDYEGYGNPLVFAPPCNTDPAKTDAYEGYGGYWEYNVPFNPPPATSSQPRETNGCENDETVIFSPPSLSQPTEAGHNKGHEGWEDYNGKYIYAPRSKLKSDSKSAKARSSRKA